MGALLVAGSVVVSVIAGLGVAKALITLMLSVLPSIRPIRPGQADIAP